MGVGILELDDAPAQLCDKLLAIDDTVNEAMEAKNR